jgi:exodeoxyribonuclease V alpha subunit
LLTRSLFYTGITRAKRKVDIWALPARLAEAVNTRAERAAGLAERLAKERVVKKTAEPLSSPPTIEPQGDQLSLF